MRCCKTGNTKPLQVLKLNKVGVRRGTKYPIDKILKLEHKYVLLRHLES